MLIHRDYSRILLILLLLILVACSNAPEQGAATSLPATLASPQTGSPTAPPGAAGAPTAQPFTPAPLVSTPVAPAAPSVAATAGAAPTEPIPGLIGPDNFPEGVNPLTGLAVEDPSRLLHRPIAIKISNYPAIVRPQSGLNNADMVFEHYAEGGVTRFTAIFYGNDANPVGSIRSGRIIDLEIPKMYDAAFAYSGASGPVRLMLRDSPFFDRIISPDFGHGGFFRVPAPEKAFEHTLFTDTGTLRAILQERGVDAPPNFQTNMAFHQTPPAGGVAASAIEVRYRGTNAYWRFDPITGGYWRSTDGVAHVDANTGNQLNFKNIVVVAAHHEDTTIIEDSAGNFSIQIQVWGEGPVSIFRNGQRFDGRWRRIGENDMLTFYDLEGNILPLAPGNSFVELVPLGFTGLVVTP